MFILRMDDWVICKMNGTLDVIVLLELCCFLPNSSMNLYNQIISLLAFVEITYSSSIVQSATTFCSFEIQLIVVPPTVKTYPVVLLLMFLSPTISHQHILVEQCLNLQNIMHKKWYLSNTWESTVLISNALYLDYSYNFSQLPLHVQDLVLCTPLHISSFKPLMNREYWTCYLSLPVSLDTYPCLVWNDWTKVYWLVLHFGF